MTDANDHPGVLVLGASGGIGSALVRRLRKKQVSVMAASRDAVRLEALHAETGAVARTVDAIDTEAVELAARAAAESFGRLDGIVNCAGSLLLKPAHLTTPDEWSATIETNLGTAFSAVRAAGRVMRGGGSVVLVSSAAARIGLANHEAIAAAKAGVIGLARSAAATYASRNLRVNAVAPGLVRTPMTERITSNEKVAASSAGLHALGRFGEPDEIASTIDWLLDAEQAWVTGQVFGIDGGLSSVRSRQG